MNTLLNPIRAFFSPKIDQTISDFLDRYQAMEFRDACVAITQEWSEQEQMQVLLLVFLGVTRGKIDQQLMPTRESRHDGIGSYVRASQLMAQP